MTLPIIHHQNPRNQIIPRDYQLTAAKLGADALNKSGNTLQVIPTGGGKTVTALLTANQSGYDRALILVHREELVRQWIAATNLVTPDHHTSTVTSEKKDWSGKISIAMVPTLCRNGTLEKMPSFDLIIVDEAHHSIADSWQTIINTARNKNKSVKLYGCTATPERGDGKGLRRVFSNVSFSLPLKTLVDAGHLVEPRAYAFDIAPPDEVDRVTRAASDFGEQDQVAAVLNTPEANSRAVELWKEKAAGRRTIAFASNVAHAYALEGAWKAAGVASETLTGETAPRDRKAILARLASGETTIVTNCAVLTEGFYEPLVSCAVLIRGCSNKSLMIQMAGRALRTVDAARYPGVLKTDAIILDFGRSLARHGDLLAGQGLDDRERGEGLIKVCPECEGEVPLAVKICPLCGFVFPTADEERDESDKADIIKRAKLIEIDVLNRSPFSWEPIDDSAVVAVGFSASAAVRRWGQGWIAVGLPKGERAVPLRIGHRYQAIAAADDFLRTHETGETAHKTSGWLAMLPTPRQIELLEENNIPALGLTRYGASAQLTWAWSQKRIKAACLQAIGK